MVERKVGRWLIYGLMVPSERCLFYIGKTHKRRELRVLEHVEAANRGGKSPVHAFIREVISSGEMPEIFVIERVPSTASWREAERRQIAKFRDIDELELPILILPQTAKSSPVEIASVRLMNVSEGG